MRNACLPVLLVLAGVPAAQAANAPDACTLVTAEDVRTVLGAGFRVSPVRLPAGSRSSYCAYRREDTLVLLAVDPFATDARNELQLEKEYLAEKEGAAVADAAGPGPGAFTSTRDGVTSLIFGKGNWHVKLEVRTGAKSNADAEQKLAAIAWGRLP